MIEPIENSMTLLSMLFKVEKSYMTYIYIFHINFYQIERVKLLFITSLLICGTYNVIQCHMTFQYSNKATLSPEISRQQVQQHNHFFIHIGYSFPLSLSTIWGNHLPFSFMLKFPISTIWRNHLPFNQ